MYKLGLVGLPNVGKTTIFSLLTNSEAFIANYPFATIEPNEGIFFLRDERLGLLESHFKSKKVVPSSIKIIDIAGLVKGASKGVGLGNEFLSHIREVEAICLVTRCFLDKEIIHVEKRIDPIEDYKIIKTELLFSDLIQLEKQEKKTKDLKVRGILRNFREKIEKAIEKDEETILSLEEKKIAKKYNFLSEKPVLVLANHGEKKEDLKEIEDYAKRKKITFLSVSALFELEKQKLSSEEKKTLGIKDEDSFFFNFSQKIKQALGLKTFFTAGPEEVKSWLIEEEKEARECSSLIHTDIAKNLIGVEIENLESLKNKKKTTSIKKGTDFLIKDGDVCLFIFNKIKK